jgi:hypothetical protein
MELVHAKDGNRLLLTLRTLNLRRWDDKAVHPCRPRKNRRTGGSLPAAFCENFEQGGISTVIAARREDPAAYLRERVALLMLLLGMRAPIE